MRRVFSLIALLMTLTACANGQRQIEEDFEPLGDFKLGHAVVLAPNLTKGPLSRDASEEEWIAALDKEVEARFRRYQGDKFYHLGISIEGYVLAAPGIPLVLSPKSALIVRVLVRDDAAGERLNEESQMLTVLESASAQTVIGSGLTQSKEKQMENLSANMALRIETWLRRMQVEEGWFGGEFATGPDPLTAQELSIEQSLQEAILSDAPRADTTPTRDNSATR